ncbi:hypothetical protein SDRG_15126 [Saprolegnia diclina VS20]|uniref:Uncharacterized protein n=1 Tax=Saprolegnia diclina (strain VS20) TaxID=1156394 RepID=T0R4U9_SAPDV|nr:hypothetical protein SDRG_15126 [Saprolegnia diclina VS20]EQC27118.1 hypothetical protein SDRG_15126 [Saprolegnia diclina VS20]|eukprot:XP_008619512.1 hypothetical protein SDRG_15126 [Saprolegnia diclina VS20]
MASRSRTSSASSSADVRGGSEFELTISEQETLKRVTAGQGNDDDAASRSSGEIATSDDGAPDGHEAPKDAASVTNDDDDDDEDSRHYELTPSEREILSFDNADDLIAAYLVAHRLANATSNEQADASEPASSDVVDEDTRPLPTGRPRQIFCNETPCDLVWERKSIEGTVYILLRPGAPDFTVCASCFAACKHTYEAPDAFTTKAASEFPPLTETSRMRLQGYQNVVHRWRNDGPWIVGILILSPVAMPLLGVLSACNVSSASLHWVLGRPLAIWRGLDKVALFVFGIYLSGVLVLLILTCPFRSQIVFWGLLEIYTLVFFVMYLIDPPTDCESLFEALLSPLFAIHNMLRRLSRASSHALLVHFAAEAAEIDVTTLRFIAADGTPVPSAHVAAAFEADSIAQYERQRLSSPLHYVLLFICVTIFLNEILVVSWPGGAMPISVLLPGVNGLVTSPKDTMYAVMFSVPACTNVSATTVDALINLWVDPVPRGSPHITFGFTSNSSIATFNTTFELVSLWDVNIQQVRARNVTIALDDMQSALTLRARFPMTCNDVLELDLNWHVAFESVSLSAFTNYLGAVYAPVGILQLILAVKYLMQLASITMLLFASSCKIWSLWLRFDTISAFGLDLPLKGRTVIALTEGENVHAWFTLRNGVRAATALIADFTSVFICGALLQFACTAAGILVYCISGSAPLPTYFLLLIGLFGSLSTLTMLVPLAAALDIQGKHSGMLRTHLLELEFQRQKAVQSGDATGFPARIAMFETIIDAIEHHDDRLSFFGIEISLARLATLGATLASLLSFVAFRVVPITWSNLNGLDLFGSTYRDALDPLINTPQITQGILRF